MYVHYIITHTPCPPPPPPPPNLPLRVHTIFSQQVEHPYSHEDHRSEKYILNNKKYQHMHK